MGIERPSESELFSLEVSKSVSFWKDISRDAGVPVYVKGGATRDSLVNKIHGTDLEVKDLDLIVPHGFFKVVEVARSRGLQIEERGKRKKLPMYHFSGIDGGIEVDLGNLLVGPENTGNISSEKELLLQDALVSDLDINTISYNLSDGRLEDPLGAINAIHSRQVGLVSERSLFLDPSAVFRCLKVAYKTGFDVVPESKEMIRKNVALLGRLQGWFLEKNLDAVLTYASAEDVLAYLTDLGILDVRPEIAEYVINWRNE
jgi:tRNA nucleotidyltransferase/poly(A) polymerase